MKLKKKNFKINSFSMIGKKRTRIRLAITIHDVFEFDAKVKKIVFFHSSFSLFVV